MRLEASITRSAPVAAAPATVLALLSDVPDSTAHFPTLLSLVPERGGYTWTLAPVRVKGVSVQLVYGCRYTTDAAAGTVTWAPVEGIGNAAVTGGWAVTASGTGSLLTLRNHVILDISLPRLLRPLAQPTLEQNNTTLIEGYLKNLAVTLDGGNGRLR
jgi:carbon monoxide dehydrogenase subunit G